MQPTSDLQIQTAEAGEGPLFHRRYSVEFSRGSLSARELMQQLQQDINSCSPQLLAKFCKCCGKPHELRVGDEFQIFLSGPWDAPVRVTDVTPQSFRLITLEGHPEAGEIEFRVQELDREWIRFEIESWARSRDRIVHFLYDRVPVVRMAQTTMWVMFCETFVRHATGDEVSQVNVLTERKDPESGTWQTL